MKTSRFFAALSVLFWVFLTTTPSFAAPDEYDDSQSNPLRVVAYLIHPAAFLIEWTVFRPLHWIVSATEPQEEIFGHTPHPPLFAEPQPDGNYGMPQKAPIRPMDTPKPQEQTRGPKEPAAERLRVVEVPVERVVYQEVPKIVEKERVIFPDVAFRFDSAELTELGKGRVYLAAQKLKEKNDVAVIIEGYTDDVGNAAYNQRLGLRRARAVVAELVAQGIDARRISAVSEGETKPLIDQTTPWARAVNRRVEFQVRGQ